MTSSACPQQFWVTGSVPPTGTVHPWATGAVGSGSAYIEPQSIRFNMKNYLDCYDKIEEKETE